MSKKILIFHTRGGSQIRNMAKDFLYSFRKYSDNKVVYFNLFTNKIPFYLKKINFDMVIFEPSVTSCWKKQQYFHRIKIFAGFLSDSKAIKVALFQDEYINTEMSVQFLNALEIEYAYSVAPKEEWANIYKGLRKHCIIFPMLTGYIEKKPAEYYMKKLNKKRNIDIGYRAAWNKPSIALGKFGYDKIKIAKIFTKRLKDSKYHTDIKVGLQFLLKGDNWTDFLSSCRFILGVESGGSVLDRDGSIHEAVNAAINEDNNISVEKLYKSYVENADGQFELRAISPRHFEAIEEGACQILYEGEYNGILKPGVHYIELKKDHSNLEDVIAQIDDEEQRKKIVEQAFHDIIESDKYTYENFIHDFYNTLFKGIEKDIGTIHLLESIYIWFAAIHEYKIKFYISVLTKLKKWNVLHWMNENRLTRYLLKGYYARRL